jgi:hypothetical protein
VTSLLGIDFMLAVGWYTLARRLPAPRAVRVAAVARLLGSLLVSAAIDAEREQADPLAEPRLVPIGAALEQLYRAITAGSSSRG